MNYKTFAWYTTLPPHAIPKFIQIFQSRFINEGIILTNTHERTVTFTSMGIQQVHIIQVKMVQAISDDGLLELGRELQDVEAETEMCLAIVN